MSGKPFTTFIEGQPVPKGRPRVTRSGHAYTPSRTVEWEETVAWHTSAAMRGRKRFLGPVKVELTFYGARANADLDNLAKAVLDGMNMTVYQDDIQVVQLVVNRSMERRKGVDIRVEAA